MRNLLRWLDREWERHGGKVIGLAVTYLALASAGKLWYSLPHLIWDKEEWSALDLKYRHNEVVQWFAGNPVYGVVDGAVYPPASHAILWPLLGWLPLEPARLLWAVTTLAASALLFWLLYRCSGSSTPRNRLLLSGLAFAAYPLQMSVFVGQMGMHVVALTGIGALLLLHDRPRWITDALGGAFLACSLVKPTLALPLVIGSVIAIGRLRPVLLMVGCYAALTWVADWAQPAGIVTLVWEWLSVASTRVTVGRGVPNLHLLLAWAGLKSWTLPASLLVLGTMTTWMWRWRRADPWVLLGIAGVVARIWAHSTLYDDAILLLPSLALIRIAFGAVESGRRSAAGWLFAACWASLLTPTWAFYDLGPTVLGVLHTGHTILWLTVLAFLGAVACCVQEATAEGERNRQFTRSQGGERGEPRNQRHH